MSYRHLTSLLIGVLVSGLFLLPANAASAGLATASASAPNPGGCGLAQPTFCETFDAPAGIGNRSGDLDGVLWGVSRLGDQNLGAPIDGWAQARLLMCGGVQTVTSPNDVRICNGQLVEGYDDNQKVSSLALYPKQPFDFAGRTGKVTFDVGNDTQGNHSAWPEFWITDKPVPTPFAHEDTLWSLPQNGFGIRFAGFVDRSGRAQTCPEGNAYVGVDSAITVANYVENDTFNGGNLALQGLDCIKKSTDPNQLNHYEIDVSQNQIDVYGTDAGTTTPLKHLATVANANLNFTHGLIWIEDAHYNGSKFNSQGTHTFIWDNVGFDGPVVARDLTYDANESLTNSGQTGQNTGLPLMNLGWGVSANTSQSFTFDKVANPGTAQAALVTFGFWYEANPPFSIDYTVNGHSHTQAWPYPETKAFIDRTLAVPVPTSELQEGSNTVTISPAVSMNIFNVDLVLVGAGGSGAGQVVSPPAVPADSGQSTQSPSDGVPPGDSSEPAPSTDTIQPADDGGAAPMAIAQEDTPVPIPPDASDTSAPPAAPTAGSCRFLTAPGTPTAFCDSLSSGLQAGGRSGDLDSSKWSIGRFSGDSNTNSTLVRFPPTPASACRAGVTSTTADDDILVCDSSSGHAGQMLTTLSAQNYGLLSMRPRQVFDFGGRTGTITYNVDALTEGGLSWWTSLFVTDEPIPGANNTEKVTGEIPRNGVGINFDDACHTQAARIRVNSVYVFRDYAETQIPVNGADCAQVQRGMLNHVEVRLSQTEIQIWVSDASQDGGQSFPNFRKIGDAAINLTFTSGYVHFQEEERAPKKYASQFDISPGYVNNYWSALGFDGPVVGTEVGYSVGDALTSNNDGGVNLGYALPNTPNSTYTCCPQTTIDGFNLLNVDLTGVGSAKLAFSVYYTFVGSNTPTSIALQYRLNGGAWHTPNPGPDYSKAFYCATCPFPPGNANWSVGYAFPLPTSELLNGTNTIDIKTDGTFNGIPPTLGNLDLLTFAS